MIERRMPRRSRLHGICLAAVVATTLVASPASAQSVPFVCEGQAFVVQDVSAVLNRVGLNGAATLTPILAPAGIEYNNLGYRSTDGLLYAVRIENTGYQAGNPRIVKIDSAGVVTVLDGAAPLLPQGAATRFDAGDVSADGSTLYITFGARNGDAQALHKNELYRVDLTTSPPTLLGGTFVPITGDDAWVNDWAYNPNDDRLYGGDQWGEGPFSPTGGQLSVLDPGANPAVRTDYDVPGLPRGTAFGAAWYDSLRDTVFLYRNSGTIYEIDVSDLAGAGPTIVNSWSAPASSRNDGAFCAPEEAGEPDIDVEKLVSDDGATWYDADIEAEKLEVMAGDDVYFKFVVTNTGDITLTDITLADNTYDLSGCSLTDPLVPADSFECIIGPFAAQAGLHTNTATVTGEYEEGQTVQDSDPANYFGIDPAIDVEKLVSDNGADWYDADSAETALPVLECADVWFKFVVTNTGNVELTNIALTDDTHDASGCTLTDPLAPEESFECVIGPFSACHGEQIDTATASGDYDATTYSDSDPAYYVGNLYGEFRTQTPGGWGAPPEGNNPGAYLAANFESCFGDLTVGCDYTITLTSPEAIEQFLPTGGKPGALKKDHLDPDRRTAGGTLAGHVVALALSVGFDACDDDFSASETSLAGLVVADESSLCYGMTVQEVLSEAEDVLGGCGSFTPAEIYECVSAINENFVDGQMDNGFLKLPCACP